MGTPIVSLLESAGGGGGSLPPKVINVAADFPTIIEADADIGRIYIAATNVTDNDPTKTNTGQSFLSGEEFVWDGISAYFKLGANALWLDDGTDYKTISPPRNLDLQNKDLKNVSSAGIGNLSLTGNTITITSGDLNLNSLNDVILQSTSATGVVEILKDTGFPAFSYNNATNKFTFNDDIAITVGGDLEVNTIKKYNAITGVTIEDVALLNGNITLPVNKKINFGDAIDTEFDLLDIDTGEALGLLFQYNRMNSLSGSVQLFRCQNPNAGDRAGFMTESFGSHAENYITTRSDGASTYLYYGYMENGIPSSSGGDRRMFEVGMNTTTNTYTIGYGSKTAGQVMTFTNYLKMDGAINLTTLSMDLGVTGFINQAGIFAEIYVADASTAQSIPTGATYTKSTAFTTDGENSNCTADATNDKITLTQVGKYRVSGSCSALSGTANVLWRGAAFLNNVEQNQIHWKRKMTTNTDSGDMSFTGFIDVTSAPWDLDFRLRHDNGGSVGFTIEYANLNVEYMGAT